jgi:putative iron-only hydrogenase system regulator
METRIAAVSIIVENPDSVERINNILHEYSRYIIGRMGIPYKQRRMSIICVVMDAPSDAISALSGKLGMLPNVTAKTAYSKLLNNEQPPGEGIVPSDDSLPSIH